MAAAAREAGLARGTVHQYFETKEALMPPALRLYEKSSNETQWICSRSWNSVHVR